MIETRPVDSAQLPMRFSTKPRDSVWTFRAMQIRLTLFISFGLAIALNACTIRVDNHGNELDPDKVAEIRPGVHTKAQVQTMLGSPSSVAPFDNNIWYYVSEVGETVWFYPEEKTERQILKINFETNGTVANIERYGLDDGREVALVDRTTPTRGENLTFIQQMWQALIGGPVGPLGGNVDVTGRSQRQ